MSSSGPRVAIVGAGIGGLTLAAALARAGVPYTVYEQAERLSEVGAGLQLAPGTVRLLHRLGLSGALRESAVTPLSQDIRRWDDDRLLARTELGAECEALYGAPYLTIHRAALHGALHAAAPDAVRLGHRLSGVTQRQDAAVLHFEGGAAVEADVVVGADGIRSLLRNRLAQDAPVFSGQLVYRGLVPGHRVPELARTPRIRVWLGPGRHCVCYPVSGGTELSFVATTPSPPGAPPPDETWAATADPADAAEAYRGWNTRLRALLGAAERVGLWALHDRAPLTTWSTDRITLLGDAAHPMLPFAAQGANQAVEDAMTLAACLVRARGGGLGAALRRYEAVRVPRTELIQTSSRERAESMHLPDGDRQQARDTALAQAGGLRAQAWLYGYDPMAAVARVPA